MSALALALREAPPERLDLSALTPSRLAHMSLADIERLPLGTTRRNLRAGDVFQITDGARDRVVFAGGSVRFDFVGAKLDAGSLLVEGDVGAYVGRAMTGGRLEVRGSAGPVLASQMSGGAIFVAGDAGEDIGGAMPGETQGMSGGIVVVAGSAGAQVGNRMRRGLIVIRGRTGPHAGSRMIGGTVLAQQGFGDEPGPLMRRGTLIGPSVGELLPTFVDCGEHELLFLRLLARRAAEIDDLRMIAIPTHARRFAGDMATIGKGEILVTAHR